MEIITGYAGRGHVTSAQTGATNAAIFGDGQYILNVGSKMAATKVDNNHVSIANGYGIDQGRFFVTTGETVTIETGSAGSKREDLIVARYEKTNAGVETSTLKVIKGTAGDEYATPSYVQGDILAGDSADEMVLYKVHLDGNEIDEIITVASIASVMTEKVDKESGKGLSTNDYTTAEKEKLAGVEAGATNTTVENSLTSDSTTNALSAAQGKALNNSLTQLKWVNKTNTYRPLTVSGLTFSDYDWTVFENDLEIIFRFFVTATATFSAWTKIVDFTIPMAFENYINVPKWNNTSDVGDCQVRIKSDGLYLRINKTGNYSPVITGCKA